MKFLFNPFEKDLEKLYKKYTIFYYMNFTCAILSYLMLIFCVIENKPMFNILFNFIFVLFNSLLAYNSIIQMREIQHEKVNKLKENKLI